MSTGDRHAHAGHSAAHVLADPGVAHFLAQPFRLDTDHDIIDGAGYSLDGRTRFVCRNLIAAVRRGEFVVDGKTIDERTFLGPTLVHEGTEKGRLDTSADIYPGAHEDWACPAEDEVIVHLGFKPKSWNPPLGILINKYCATAWQKPDFNPPKTLDCSPLLDDPDANDIQAIKALKAKGVGDAFKLPRTVVHYAQAKAGAEHCGACINYQGDATGGTCKIVNGYVQSGAWCRKFEEKDQQQMPPVSKAQNAAMYAAASGKSTLGIPASVGREYTAGQGPGATAGLPQHVTDARHHALRKASATHLHAAGDMTAAHHDRVHADADRQLAMLRGAKGTAATATGPAGGGPAAPAPSFGRLAP